MSVKAFNIALGGSVAMLGVGIACLSIPAALISVGALVLGLTLYVAHTAGVR